ncbi:unnamed protein product, partial [marine sediment metagenome]
QKEQANNAKKTMLKAVIMIERDAKRFSPFDTGNLRASINHKVEQKGQITLGRVKTKVEYASYQEFGTSRGVPPHPYFRPALQQNKAKILSMMKNVLIIEPTKEKPTL